MSVDFPEPLTPVMQIKPPSGICTSTFLRLFSRQPLSSRHALSGSTGRRVGRRDDRVFAGEIFDRDALVSG